MIAIAQRVARADVSVAGVSVGAIGQGLLVFACAEPTDTEAIADKLIHKLLKLRVFADEIGRASCRERVC